MIGPRKALGLACCLLLCSGMGSGGCVAEPQREGPTLTILERGGDASSSPERGGPERGPMEQWVPEPQRPDIQKPDARGEPAAEGSPDVDAGASDAAKPQRHQVKVKGGSGGGRYLPGRKVQIEADPPAQGKAFDTWTGDVAALPNPSKPKQSFTMPARDLSFAAKYRSVVQSLKPCQGSLCWQNAPRLSGTCGKNLLAESFASGRYNVHRFPFKPPNNVDVELTLSRTAGTFAPALLLQDAAGQTLYDGVSATSNAKVKITPLASGKAATTAKVRLKTSASMELFVFVTSWAMVADGFTKAMPKEVKYTLTASADCPAPKAVCPMNPASISHFGSGYFSASDSRDRSSPNYNPHKRDSRTSHSGYDLHAPLDVPVVATQDGTIVASNTANTGDCGRSINLAASTGVTFRYCHLNKVVVASGAVKAGQLIGYNGKTGNANSPHIHFVYIDAPNVKTSGALSQRSKKVNAYIDGLCRSSP